MKKVRLITTDDNNGKLAISRTPLRNKFFFEGAWHEINVTTKPEIIGDARIIDTAHAVYAELTDTFDKRNFLVRVENECYDNGKHPVQETISRRLRELKDLDLINYEVVNSAKGIYKKLPVISKTCDQQGKIEFKPDIKKRFIEFLKAEGAYEKYMESFKKEEPSVDLWKFFEDDEPDMLASGAFNWNATIQGHNYWRLLNVKWQKICKTL